ncbi:uncharacterized protein [Nicotiana tomentosiformis]|uniref:uncharacterized protein n=1 Tax=Nicotiana tomentosiformis TaxID=4098 RepID=UPI00388C4E76
MGGDKVQDKSSEGMENKFSEIQDQLQKLMEGMTNMNERNTQTDKELFEIKEAIRFMKQRNKGAAQFGVEPSIDGDSSTCPIRIHRQREMHIGSTSTGNNLFIRYSRLEFSQYSGSDLRSWLYKVDHVFSMEEVTFDERVNAASIHFDGEVIAWHRSYMRSRNIVAFPTWTEYVLALNERFGEGFEDPMESIKNLKQIGSVGEYQAEFDRLLTEVNLANDNAISCFLGGLKPELNKAVKIQSPRIFMQAYKIARLQEGVFEAQAQSWGLKPVVRSPNHILPIPIQTKLQNSQKPPIPSSTFKRPFELNPNKPNRINSNSSGRRLTAAEMDEKRANGLCFFSDEKYVPGHSCKAKRHIFMVELNEEDTRIEVEVGESLQEAVEGIYEFMTISLQAFTGVTGYQAIRVTGYHEKRPLQVLIDTGSIHNFIDLEVAKRLGCKASPIVEQSISVADGRKVQTTSVCKNMQWLLQGTIFSSDFLLLPLGNVDIVLGVQWLSTLGRILFDIRNRIIEFVYQGNNHVLRGVTSQLKAAKANSLAKKNGVDTQFFMMTVISSEEESNHCHHIQAIQGYFISAEGVSTDPKKNAAVQQWPVPRNIKQLRGFLGLAGYYMRFIQGFGSICKPLHELLKKDGFLWTEESTTVFLKLKQA